MSIKLPRVKIPSAKLPCEDGEERRYFVTPIIRWKKIPEVHELGQGQRFTIEKDHVKIYTILITDWSREHVYRVVKPYEVPFDHNQRLSAFGEHLKQYFLVKEPSLRMKGELHFRGPREATLDSEALLKEAIPYPEKQFLHTNTKGIKHKGRWFDITMTYLNTGKLRNVHMDDDSTSDSTDEDSASTLMEETMSVAGSKGEQASGSAFMEEKNTTPVAESKGEQATSAFVEKASRTKPKVPDEIIMFVIDTSESMRWPAASGISDRYDDEVWLEQDQEAKENRRFSYQAGSMRLEEDMESMSVQELIGILSDDASFEDILAILHLQSDTDRENCAYSILEHLRTLCTRERCHYEELIIKAVETPGTDSRQRQQDSYNESRYIWLVEIITGLLKHNSQLAEWLCDRASRQFPWSTWRWTFNNGTPEGSGNSISTTPRPGNHTLIKVYHGRDHTHLFSYWVDRAKVHPYTSVIFRYWRYLAEERRQDFDKDVDIWTEIRYLGDGRCFGKLNSHWDVIPGERPDHGTGILGPERLYFKPGDPSNDESDQNILVLKMHVESHDYQQRMDEAEVKRQDHSRLLVSQTFVDAFIDRALAYSINCHIGLVTFNSCVDLVQDITRDIQNLHDCIATAQPGGDTRICDAFSIAGSRLLEYASNYPTARKRIICLSDGLGSASCYKAQDLVTDLVESEVVVDSVSFRANNSVLHAITWLTGGDDFVPKDNDEILAVAQLEAFLFPQQRDPPPQPRPGTIDSFRTARRAGQHKPIRATIADRRRLLQPSAVNDQFVEPAWSMLKNTQSKNPAPRHLMDVYDHRAPATQSHNHSVRVRAEIRALNYIITGSERYRIYVSEEDITLWLVVMEPGQTADIALYNTGVWLFYIHMLPSYPLSPPDVRFKSPLWHLNVNLDLRVCHRLLYQDWTPDVTNLQIIDAVLETLRLPRMDDAVNLTAFRQMWHTGTGPVEYEDEIFRQREMYAAGRSRKQWHNALKMKVDKLPEEGPERNYIKERDDRRWDWGKDSTWQISQEELEYIAKKEGYDIEDLEVDEDDEFPEYVFGEVDDYDDDEMEEELDGYDS